MEWKDLEFDIMDELYFVISYSELTTALSHYKDNLNQGLISLLRQALIQQLRFEEETGDFVACDPPDFHHMERYHYLATKKGLLAHNG